MLANAQVKTEKNLDLIQIQTKHFGEVEVEKKAVIKLSRSMPGFDSTRTLALLEIEKYQPFVWFQSLQDRQVCFPAILLSQFLEEYNLKVTDEDKQLLDIESDDDLLIFGVTAFKGAGQSVNLAAPLLMNRKTHTIIQVLNQEDGYALDQPLEFAA